MRAAGMFQLTNHKCQADPQDPKQITFMYIIKHGMPPPDGLTCEHAYSASASCHVVGESSGMHTYVCVLLLSLCTNCQCQSGSAGCMLRINFLCTVKNCMEGLHHIHK
jgi:hypothetical protein